MISMSVIGPTNWGDLIPAGAIEQAIINATKMSSEGVRTDFDVTVQTWKHNVDFYMRAIDKFTIVVGTGDEIYGYVNNGTSAHDIFPRGKRLRFQTGYRAKTRPNGRIASYGGGKSGPFVFARKVRHPGTSGRFFNKIIARKWKRQYPIQMRRAIRAASKKHGK